jgi:hypothetical protein
MLPDHKNQLCSQYMLFPKLFQGNGFWTFLKMSKILKDFLVKSFKSWFLEFYFY